MQCTVLKMVEYLRQELYKAVQGRSLTDPEVIEVSQELDHLLNQYHCLSTRGPKTSDAYI